MPITDSVNQEAPEQVGTAEVEQPLDNVSGPASGTEVSSTTQDPEQLEQTSAPEEGYGEAEELVASSLGNAEATTSSVNIIETSDSVDINNTGVSNSSVVSDSVAGKDMTASSSVAVTEAPSSDANILAEETSSSDVAPDGKLSSFSFQSAFAAFASQRQEKEVEEPMQVDSAGQTLQYVSEVPHAALNPATSMDNVSVTSESYVTSAIDSGHVTTTGESLVSAVQGQEGSDHNQIVFTDAGGTPDVVCTAQDGVQKGIDSQPVMDAFQQQGVEETSGEGHSEQAISYQQEMDQVEPVVSEQPIADGLSAEQSQPEQPVIEQAHTDADAVEQEQPEPTALEFQQVLEHPESDPVVIEQLQSEPTEGPGAGPSVTEHPQAEPAIIEQPRVESTVVEHQTEPSVMEYPQVDPAVEHPTEPALEHQVEPTALEHSAELAGIEQQGDSVVMEQQGDSVVVEQQDEPVVEQQGEPVVMEQHGEAVMMEQQGEPVVLGEQQVEAAVVEQQGEPLVEQEGEPVVEQQGESVVEQQGEPVVMEQQGEPLVMEQQGEPVVMEQGEAVLMGQGEPVVEEQGEAAVMEQGEAVVMEQQGEPVVMEQQGEAAVMEQQGEAAVMEQQGEAAVMEQQGESAVMEQQGEPVVMEQGESVVMGQGEAVVEQQGEAAVMEQQGEPVVMEQQGESVVEQQGEPVVMEQQGEAVVEQQGEAVVMEQQGEAAVMEQQGEPTVADHSQGEQAQPELAPTDAVYFIQMTDASGQILTSIIDPNDIAAYADSVVYKQCMGADGQIETTIVNSGTIPSAQEQQTVEPQQEEAQVIYAYDENGQLSAIDSVQSANDVAPPGKQFVYMQEPSGRIIRTIMDANQTMVPGQQVYYTQSENGQMISSVMDSPSVEDTTLQQQQQQEEMLQQAQAQAQPQGQASSEQAAEQDATPTTSAVMGTSTGFNLDNSMSGLSMLAELSHLTSGQGNMELKTASSTDSNSQDADMEEFRPVAMVTRKVEEEGVEGVSSEISGLKMTGNETAESQTSDQPQESIVAQIVSQMKGGPIQPSMTVSRDNLFVQWQNLDAMCWMDVVLIMLVYSPTLRPLTNLEPTHELTSTLLLTLLKANRQAQVLLQNLLKKSNGAEISSLQTGAGNSASTQDPKMSKLVCKENMDEIGKAINILYAMREKIWQALQPRLRCERGKHNSPVLVLPLLVREKPVIKQMFTMNYRYVFKCEKCNYSQDDSHTKILPSIPAVPPDFNMVEPCFVRNCFECQAPNQRMMMKFEGLQDFVQMHFVKGLPHNRFDELDFYFNGDHYEVTAAVHYKNNPDHFIAWVRNAPGNTWMECDDLKSVITRYQAVVPNIPPSQIHMVMWERRLTPQHTLVMRDTEDTKLLASLVLTVQQPGATSTQTPSQTTDTASTMGAAQRTAISTLTSPGQGQTSQASTASNLLSGIMNQSSTFTPYTLRGRGSRGGRGRGSRGGRGRGATSSTFMRTITPETISPTVSTPRPRTSPQILRLPLSALTNAGLSMRGGMASGSRLVLMSSNSSGSAGGTGGKQVMVVKSHGGSGGLNLTATQLLQLLQRSGAISQAGGRITTTITSSNANTSTATVTEGQAQQSSEASTLTAEKMETSETEAAPADPAVTGLDTGEVAEQQPLVSETEASIPSDGSAMETQDETETTQEGAETPAAPVSEQESSQTVSNATSTVIVSPEAGSSSSLTATTSTPSPAVRTISLGRGPGPLLQIPNASRTGHITTQLVMKDGKYMLVSVDKNAAATASQGTPSQAVIKLPISSSTGSPTVSIRSMALQSMQTSTASSVSTLPLQSVSQTTTPQQTTRFITIPGGGTGGKKIQLIGMPRGASGSTSAQGGQKTIILTPGGLQGSGATTLNVAGSPTTTTRLIATAEATSGSDSRASGNILIRDVKRSEESSISVLSDATKQTPRIISMAGSSGRDDLFGDESRTRFIGGTPAVSLLKDVSMRTGALGTSLLTNPSSQSKAQESFKYILPGSNTGTQAIVHSATGTLNQGTRTFTALSSSGTIIGGQLTPASTSSTGTSMDQGTLVDSGDEGIGTPFRGFKDDDTEYIPLGRGRGRGGRRGRGSRGPRGTRGRGRQPAQQILMHSDLSQAKALSQTPSGVSTLTDLRQIGAQVIESTPEAVDGVPVLSIPDFSTVATMHTESVSAAEAILSDNAQPVSGSGVTMTSPGSLEVGTEPGQASLGPRVITQTIPSIKANHGFDILTQGIMGRPSGASATSKPGLSLLTGKSAMVESPSASTTVLTEASLLTSASKTHESLSIGQSVSQTEIDTLIQAAEAAAKPAGIKGKSLLSTAAADKVAGSSEESTEHKKGEEDFNVDDFLTMPHEQDQQEPKEIAEKMEVEEAGEEPRHDVEERVVSVDESQVSAAERYRMPAELFQPDEESPEKPLRSEEGSKPELSVAELPSKLFQDSEVSSQSQEEETSPSSPQKSGKLCDKDNGLPEPMEATESELQLENVPFNEARVEVAEEVQEESVKKPGKRGRPKGKGKRGRRKSNSVSGTDERSPDKFGSPKAGVEAVDQYLSPQHKMETPLKSPLGSPGNKSVGGFATDLLAIGENEEVKETLVSESKFDGSVESGQESLDVGEVKPSDMELPGEKADGVSREPKPEERKMKYTLSDQQQFMKEYMYGPAVTKKRLSVAWKTEGDSDEEPIDWHAHVFNYKVLCGKRRNVSKRHPSLGPVLFSFTSPPAPYPVREKEEKEDQGPIRAVVKRRIPKAMTQPKVDPSKERMVIPLVVEEEEEPGSMGGSVVTSPMVASGQEGEMFTGVMGAQKQQLADWGVGDVEQEEEVEEEGVVLEEEEPMDERERQMEYADFLWTALSIQAGEFEPLSDGEEYSDEEEEESVINVENQNSNKEVVRENSMVLSESEVVATGDQSQATEGVKKRKKESLESPSIPPSKRSRPSQDEELDHGPNEVRSSVAPDISTVTPARVNGIDKSDALVTSESQLVTPVSSAVNQKSMTTPAPVAGSFSSPMRRSSRTPVPSKKVLDSLEDLPIKTVLKGRRSSLLSSDDELSGYSSEEALGKKLKKAEPTAPS